MKRILLLLFMATMTLTLTAQEVAKRPSYSGFVSNGFWDNWEVSGAAGVGSIITNRAQYGSFGEFWDWETNFSLTKWLHPAVGLRAQLQGGFFQTYSPAKDLEQWPYLFVHADVLINASNWIGGYREDRFWSFIPFAGMGYMASNFTCASQNIYNTTTHQDFAFAYGLLHKFRVGRSIDLTIEMKGMLVRAGAAPTDQKGSFMNGGSVTAGITYRFNKRGWQRGVAGVTMEDIMAYQMAVEESTAALIAVETQNVILAEELEQRTDALAVSEKMLEQNERRMAILNKEADQIERRWSLSAIPIIFYNYGMSGLTDVDKTRLDLVADIIKRGNKERVYMVSGYADQQTGTREGNKRVANHRAKHVYDYLISKGVAASQLKYEGHGNEPDIYRDNIKANRSVTIN